MSRTGSRAGAGQEQTRSKVRVGQKLEQDRIRGAELSGVEQSKAERRQK